MSSNLQGAMWIVVGTLLFSLNDAAVKRLGRAISPEEITFVRFVLGAVLLTPVFVRMGWQRLKTDRLGTHVLRACIASVAQFGSYYAIIHMLLASVTAIGFSRPLFQTCLALWLLKEAVSGKRWGATAVGFLGVLIMIRPGAGTFEPASLVAIAATVLFALTIILIRQLSRTEPTPRILFYYHLVSAAIFAGPAIHGWVTPDKTQAVLLFCVGALTTAAMWCFVRGYSLGETSFIGPIEYVRLVYAALIGYFIFAELPDAWTWAGAGIIVAATLHLARVESTRPRAVAA
jgi:drug/metabolite transporter (DMT)-like permease